MAFESSPIQYPTTSSPRQQPSPCKRRRVGQEEPREPLKDVGSNVHRPELKGKFAGFIDEDDSDSESPLQRLGREHLAGNSKAIKATLDLGEAHFKKHCQQDERHDSGCEIVSSPPASEREESLPLPRAGIATPNTTYQAKTCSGRTIPIRQRRKAETVHYSAIVAARSAIAPGRAQKSYYGIDIHNLVEESKAVPEGCAKEAAASECGVVQSVEPNTPARNLSGRTHLWTEKYRPRKFTDLIGDERTHRSVLRWLKGWDSIVFPSQNAKPARSADNKDIGAERTHRKILLLTGPAGLGKTTLAHVCARQAGYETHEINASDERTKDVVKGRIRDMVGTENVRGADSGSSKKTASRPVCVVVDEVDGVVSGSNAGSGGDGGFIKALIDLLVADQKNSNRRPDAAAKSKKKGDSFRMLRPLILICNDVYHPSLRLLRHSPHAEVIHVRRPALTMVVPRLCAIFEKEGVPADSDGVRTLCEAAWGVTSKRQGGKGSTGGGQGEGDIRCILVAGEWAAGKLRTTALVGVPGTARLTRRWIESNVASEMAHGGGMARSLGRGSARDVVERVFKHNAGFAASLGPVASKRKFDDRYGKEASIGVSEAVKRGTMEKLREMIESSGDDEKILLDCFQTYPTQPYQDTTTLTKPDLASDWLHFSSLCSHRLHHNQEWDLAAYQSFPILAFHNLFASSNTTSPITANDTNTTEREAHPLTTPRADSHAHETTRANTAILSHLQTQLSLPVQRSFRSQSSLITELIPYTLRILNPAVKPVLVGGASSVRRAEERERVERAVEVMVATAVRFDKSRVDLREADAGTSAGSGGNGAGSVGGGAVGRDNGGWIYRMEPPLDEVGCYPLLSFISNPSQPNNFQSNQKSKTKSDGWDGDAGKAGYGLRQVLSSSHEIAVKRSEAEARRRRVGGATSSTDAVVDAHANEHESGNGTRDGKRRDTEKKVLEEARKKAKSAIKRDFFGREIVATTVDGDAVAAVDGNGTGNQGRSGVGGKGGGNGKAGGKVEGRGAPRIWATFHEGFSNAVRKPITMKELMEGL
ncbi:MAG: hypothetical protein Q9159_003725 [Coniocarpon cinnabarinum]